jgi:hypothetical protein
VKQIIQRLELTQGIGQFTPTRRSPCWIFWVKQMINASSSFAAGDVVVMAAVELTVGI